MKGLMIKDLKLMKNLKNFVIAFAVLVLFYLFTEVSATILITYACTVSAMCVVSTISYDELDNGNAFLFTLPFARKSYVKEKYALTVLITAVVWTISMALTTLFDWYRFPDFLLSESIFSGLVIAAITFLLNAIIIPTQLKFGGNRGTLAMMMVFFLGSAIIYLAIKIFNSFGIDLKGTLNGLHSLSLSLFSAGCLLISLLCLLISYLVSVRIIEKKEF